MQQTEWMKQLGLFSKIVTEAVGYPLSGAFLGYLLWQYLGVPKLLGIGVLSCFGFCFFIYKLYKENKDKKKSQ